MKTQIKNIILGVALITLSGCYYDRVLPIEVEGEISYSQQVQTVFDSKCIGCHNGSQAPDLQSGLSYDNLMNGGYITVEAPASSLLYTKLNGGSMDGFASSNDKSTILKWIEQGANNN